MKPSVARYLWAAALVAGCGPSLDRLEVHTVTLAQAQALLAAPARPTVVNYWATW